MNIFEFMSGSPWLTFFLLLIGSSAFVQLINRILRHWNIRKHGYPPPHCDADGDFKEADE